MLIDGERLPSVACMMKSHKKKTEREKTMKFFHLADLHFGKMLHNVSLVQEDQPFWIEQFLKAVDAQQPDAVVISGDVYDRRSPSPEAMQLFDRLLTGLATRGKSVFVIPGNHDSDIRLSHVSGLLRDQQIYIAGELRKELQHVTLTSDGVPVTFWLMPFVFPRLVSDCRVLNDPDISGYDEAARALLAAQEIDFSACNVLLAHQNVLHNGNAPEHSDSESIIGGLGEIDVSAFDGFDYVALGHIHNRQPVGRETVRYAGCPLYYDFSETDRSKALTLVTIRAKDDITVESVEIPLLHRLKRVSGTLEEILELGQALTDKDSFYIQAILRDRHVPPRAMDQLQAVFGSALVNVKREPTNGAAEAETSTRSAAAGIRSTEEQFALFYQETQGELLDNAQRELIEKALDQQGRRSGSFYTDAKEVPNEDAEELIRLLLKNTEEDEYETA